MDRAGSVLGGYGGRLAACAACLKYRVPGAVILVLASQHSQLTAFIVVLIVGLLVGVYGHLIESRALILTGIALIGGVSAYFLIVVAAVR
jgi:hypothetical protein